MEHPALLLLAAAALGALVVVAGIWLHRMALLGPPPGTFRCWVGRSDQGPWRRGLARYEAERLSWWPRFSLGKTMHWSRGSLGVVSRTQTDPLGWGSDRVYVLGCQTAGACAHPDVYLLVDAAAAAGVTSWLEARPGPPNQVI
ncbi:MAG: DUF2550 domain-containing protein [Micrococcales bacterium]|nr:DUF2550 domain-containing protein [Micrococcales bacterium]